MNACQVGQSFETAVAVRRQAGLLRTGRGGSRCQAADVGAEADRAPFGASDCAHFQGSHWFFSARRAVLAQVDEVLRLSLELRDEADLDRLDVVGAGAGREVLREVRVVHPRSPGCLP